MLMPIKNDVFDIAWRIKEIDRNYYIMYDTKTQKFLLFSSKGYELTFPFSQLDARAINYARDTRIENLDTLIKEIDNFNKKKEKNDICKVHDILQNKFDLAMRKI